MTLASTVPVKNTYRLIREQEFKVCNEREVAQFFVLNVLNPKETPAVDRAHSTNQTEWIGGLMVRESGGGVVPGVGRKRPERREKDIVRDASETNTLWCREQL